MHERTKSATKHYSSNASARTWPPSVFSALGTTRKLQTSQDLPSSQSRLDLVVDKAPCGIIGLSETGVLTVANPRALELLELSEEALPRTWPQEIVFLVPETLEPLTGAASPIAQTIADIELEQRSLALRMSTQSATLKYVKVTSKRLLPSQTSQAQFVVFLEDFTEQELARQSLQRAAHLDALGQLTSGVAHDYNNLLATIDYSLVLAADEEDPKEREVYLETARRAIKRGASLSSRLLAFAKPQSGLVQEIGLRGFCEEFYTLVRPSIQEGIEVEILCEQSCHTLKCDPGGLENALLNLMINARDAILSVRSHGKITLRINDSQDGKSVCFAVQDDGPGVSEDVAQRMFDPFFSTKEAKGGSGLGLSMVYGFVKQCNGEVAVQGGLGTGAQVSLKLPVNPETLP